MLGWSAATAGRMLGQVGCWGGEGTGWAAAAAGRVLVRAGCCGGQGAGEGRMLGWTAATADRMLGWAGDWVGRVLVRAGCWGGQGPGVSVPTSSTLGRLSCPRRSAGAVQAVRQRGRELPQRPAGPGHGGRRRLRRGDDVPGPDQRHRGGGCPRNGIGPWRALLEGLCHPRTVPFLPSPGAAAPRAGRQAGGAG